MSLLVNVRIYNEHGEYSEIELKNGKDLAGGERFRSALYGSDLAEKLGLKLLPQLKLHDLYVEPTNLEELGKELEIILDNLEKFTEAAESEPEYIKARVQNIIDAVQIAKEKKGMIVIW